MLVLTMIFPLISFLLLAFSMGRWSENLSATIGIGSVGLTALVTTYVGVNFFNSGCQPLSLPLWTWISIGDFNVDFNLVLDDLSLIMLSLVTGIGLLIHIFASWYMRGEEGYSRFFAYTNLFIASMVILVLADNLMLMYLGWEGISLCSYLLISFYYNDLKNSAAAMKAFVMTRVGDVCLVFALFILYNKFGTLNFREIVELVTTAHFNIDHNTLRWVTLMLLGGAIGKSAQLPLQAWLADAMAGPTPASALIHATTMVTAGVYLIARTYSLFLITPEILHLIGVVGAITLVLASFIALVQTDIKRILAYSTMSQAGYMFLALGAQVCDAAIYHLITHAFFKALLFLSTGSVILACHHEQNIFKMGGLRKAIPLIYVCFLVGGASLAALPLLTSGYFSKDAILVGAMTNGYVNLMIVGLIGTLMTSLYTFRMIFIVFHGKEQMPACAGKGITHNLPLVVLLILSTFIGALIIPQGILPNAAKLEHGRVLTPEVISGILVIVGILLAAWLWLGKRALITTIANSRPGRLLSVWCYNSWGFDWLYNCIFVKPFFGITWLLKHDPLNILINMLAIFFRFTGKVLLFSENGYLRWYVASISIGAVGVLALLMLLQIIIN